MKLVSLVMNTLYPQIWTPNDFSGPSLAIG
jgi:hypothetical protein